MKANLAQHALLFSIYYFESSTSCILQPLSIENAFFHWMVLERGTSNWMDTVAVGGVGGAVAVVVIVVALWVYILSSPAHLLCVHLAIWFHCRGLNFSVFIVSITFEVYTFVESFIHIPDSESLSKRFSFAHSLFLSLLLFLSLSFYVCRYIFALARDMSRKLFYQRLTFVFHFNFTIFPFYIDFQCKTSASILLIERKR